MADGELYVTGRVKDIIIKGGRNLYPHEVEELAARVEGIRKGCIVAFGIKDQASGTEKMVVVAESRETSDARRLEMAAKVTEVVSRGLGLPPDRVELLPLGSIPKTSSGKLRREETKQLYLAGTLSENKAPAWLQIARLGAGGAVSATGARACERCEAWAGISVRNLFCGGVHAMDCADLDDRAALYGSSSGRKIHE